MSKIQLRQSITKTFCLLELCSLRHHFPHVHLKRKQSNSMGILVFQFKILLEILMFNKKI